MSPVNRRSTASTRCIKDTARLSLGLRSPIPCTWRVPSGVGAVWAVAVGAEAARRIPVRLELRTVFVDSHPLLHGAHQIELQARLTVLFSGR